MSNIEKLRQKKLQRQAEAAADVSLEAELISRWLQGLPGGRPEAMRRPCNGLNKALKRSLKTFKRPFKDPFRFLLGSSGGAPPPPHSAGDRAFGAMAKVKWLEAVPRSPGRSQNEGQEY